MSKISVCLATYNGEKFIKKQLESILPQLGADDEIILSDDNSTDNTLKIVHHINDYRIKISKNIGQSGPLFNFENALKQSTGDIIFLSDQDDVWLPDKVSIACQLLAANDLVLSDCRVIDALDTIIYPSFFSHRGSKPGFWQNLYKNSYVGCCMAFRREILSYALPFPSTIHMHDWWIGLLVEARGRVCFYPNPLVLYVRHGNNASPTGEAGHHYLIRLRNRFTLLWNVFKRLKQ